MDFLRPVLELSPGSFFFLELTGENWHSFIDGSIRASAIVCPSNVSKLMAKKPIVIDLSSCQSLKFFDR